MIDFALGFATAIVAWFFYRKLKLHWLQAWYPAIGFFREEGGAELKIMFRFGGANYLGYCKKLLPEGIEPSDIKIRVKHFNPKKNMYHVFWEYK